MHQCFSNESTCFAYLDSQRIFYPEMQCPSCDTAMIRNLSRQCFRCPSHNCRKEISIRYGTFFYGSAMPTSRILLISWEWLYKTPARALSHKYKFSPKTITAFYKHLRILVAGDIQEENQKIGGQGVVVEVDECKMGKRKYHRGHRVDGVWVFGGVERNDTTRVFFVKVEDRSREMLLRAIAEHIERGSIICSDLWRGYIGLSENGYQHNTVNHSLHFKDPISGTHTNTIEGIWNGLKLQITPRNRTKFIDEALLEAVWRKQNRSDLWGGLLKALRDHHYEYQ
jgi:hypothetical protein